jgi:hypothetical protein
MPSTDEPTRAELMAEAEKYADKAVRHPNHATYGEVRDAYLAGMVAGQRRALQALRKAVGMAPMPAPGSEVVQ